MRIAFLGNFGVSYSSENHHKASLEALGHEVVALQEGKTSSQDILDVALASDLFVWIHTHGWATPKIFGGPHGDGWDMPDVLDELKRKGVPSVTYHLDLRDITGIGAFS